jgi:hypothetical protein
MMMLKKVLVVLVVILMIPLITAIFVKKEYTVERSIVINRPKEEVFNYLILLKNQEEFSKWASMDRAMKKSYQGTDGTVGFIAAWESDMSEVGAGEQEIIGIKEGERLDYELRFLKPFKSTSLAYLSTESIDANQTEVVWGFKGRMTYPMNIMLLLMNFDEMIGDDLDIGLVNLKQILE